MALVRNNTRPNLTIQKRKIYPKLKSSGAATDSKNSDVDNQRLTKEARLIFAKKAQKGCFIRNLNEADLLGKSEACFFFFLQAFAASRENPPPSA
jgi:hypothetical protein